MFMTVSCEKREEPVDEEVQPVVDLTVVAEPSGAEAINTSFGLNIPGW